MFYGRSIRPIWMKLAMCLPYANLQVWFSYFFRFPLFSSKTSFFQTMGLSQIFLHAFSCRCFMADLSVRFGWNLPCAFHKPIYRYDFLTFFRFPIFSSKTSIFQLWDLVKFEALSVFFLSIHIWITCSCSLMIDAAYF